MDDLQHKPDISKANVCPPLPSNATVLDKIIYWLAIGLGSGLPKVAPGTWGTVGGMLFAIPLMMLGFTAFVIITILANIVGIWICGRASQLMGVHDDPHIVFDEWAGVWIAMIPLAHFYHYSLLVCVENCGGLLTIKQKYLLIMAIIIFVLFRFFDILKPFPISVADKKLTGGLGIMLDDTLAGIAVLLIFVGSFAMIS